MPRKSNKQHRPVTPPASEHSDADAGRPLPTLEDEIQRLAMRRDQVDAALLKRLQQDSLSTPETLRYLAVLAQVSRDLARMLAQRAAGSGNEELERFLEEVAKEARALTTDQGY